MQERIAQLNEKIRGQTAQQDAKTGRDRSDQRRNWSACEVYTARLVPIDRVNNLARAAARLCGERGALIAADAEARGRITEVELQLLQVDQTLRKRRVATELRDVNAAAGRTAGA